MLKKDRYLSVTITRIFMKFVGFWVVETRREQMLLYVALSYAILAIVFAICVEFADLYHCLGDFYALTYNLCATMLLIMILVKFGNFIYYRNIVLKLITYAEKNFWKVEYDNTSARILEEYDKRGVLMTYTFTVIVNLAAFNYIFAPLVENIGRNETDRVLPFKLWVDLPLKVTPYYEITYTIQSLSTFHSGICTFCFDNFICTFNIHVAAQLKILAHRLEMIGERYIKTMTNEKSLAIDKAADYALIELRDCVLQHRALISYIEEMERVFTIILFGQLTLSSLVICFGGFQFLAAEVLIRKCIFAIYFTGSLSQLLIYTWTCNDIIVQSSRLSESVYNSCWYLMPNEGKGKALKYGVSMIMLRSRRPCTLTAGGFAVMSLETFTGILSTSMSYFTLLRQMSEEE
ncbi:odorant receptor 13a-like [Polistes fuscatus]|uniref:odorant receptor 13a-like n=1 Tax=Polistes fuscatus TaxID=30207 RepID=UPI001CA85A4F|nr:odorant receptor 13a-like [Polistes fuscatus]